RLDEVVLRALAKEPQERYQKGSELKAEVEHTHAGPPVAQAVPRAGRHLGVRFSGQDNWGSKALGQIRLEGQTLVFEDALDYLGFYKSGVKEQQVPLADLAQFELEKNWWDATPVPLPWNSTLAVATRRLSALNGIPGATLGQARLIIAPKDRKAAEELVHAV